MITTPADYGPVLAAVKATAEAYAKAILDLTAFAIADGLQPGEGFAKEAETIAKRAGEIVLNTEREVIEAHRPKGPTVRIVVSSRWSKDYEIVGELIRTTSKQAMVCVQHGNKAAYVIETGRTAVRSRPGEAWCKIHPDDLAILKAMKPGPNAVSKARDAIEKATKR